MSLNDIANPAPREPAPLVTLVRSRMVANVDSMGFVVLKCRVELRRNDIDARPFSVMNHVDDATGL